MLTSQTVLREAAAQSARDLGCDSSRFFENAPVFIVRDAAYNPHAKRFFRNPPAVHLVSYGQNAVCAFRPEFEVLVKTYVSRYPVYHLFETPNLHWLDERLRPMGQRVCFLTEYFLPTDTLLSPGGAAPSLPYTVRRMTDFSGLTCDTWSNALSLGHPEYDVLGYGCYDGDTLVGLAACSADTETMRQVGIDVLPEYRRQHIGSTLISALTRAIAAEGKIPFAAAAWANLKSVRCLLKAGYLPAWAELTTASVDETEQWNAAD